MKKYARVILLLSIGASCFSVLNARSIFPTLTMVEKYASSLPEQVETDTDWLNPDFSSFQKSRNPGVMRRFFSWVGIGKPAWDIKAFNALLVSLTKKRELNGLLGNIIQKYEESPGDRFFIWTDLFGAFHSLVRDLVELRNRGVLSDDFKVMHPTDFLIFNGNVIDHSPYVLETLTLVMRLLEVNPEQVIYLRGDHEDKQEWQSYELAHELKVRAATISHEIIPLNKRITRFFNTLPLGLFLPVVTEKIIDVVLIANNEYSRSGFDVTNFAGFLAQGEQGKLTVFKIDNKMPSSKKVQVKVLISGEDRSVNFHQTKGLTLIGMQRESLRWLTFSSPTGRSRRLYEFFYDAFVELKTKKELKNWTLSLYNQDVRSMLGFRRSESYYLLTGEPVRKASEIKKTVPQKIEKAQKEMPPQKKGIAPKKEEAPSKKIVAAVPTQKAIPQGKREDVVVGSTIDLTKGSSVTGRLTRDGLNLAFGLVSQQGVGAYLPRITIYDDEYTPQKTRSLISKMQAEGIDIFLNPLGSPTVQAYLDLIKEGKALVLFPYTGASIFRKPDLKYLANMRVGYADEGRVLASYALDDLNTKKAVIFYQNDSFGRSTLEGVIDVFQKKRFKNFKKLPYIRNDTNFSSQLAALKRQDPDTIFFFGGIPAVKALIQQIGASFFKGRKLIGMSVYNELFENYLASKGLHFVMVRIVPDPQNDDIEIVREYRDAAQKANQVPNITSLESFINAELFFDLLKRIKPPLTKEKIIKEIEGIKNYDFKGIKLDFDPDTRELAHTIWLDTGKGAWIKKEIPWGKKEKQGEQIPAKKPTKTEEVTPEQKKQMISQEPKKAEEKQVTGEKQELLVGSTIDLTKSATYIGKSIKQGLDLAFQEVSKKGAGSYFPRITIYDDEYTPEKTMSLISKLLASGIDIVLNPVGSDTTASYLPLIKDGKVLVLFPYTGASILRKPDLKYIAHMRVGYADEGHALAEYALNELGVQKAAIFYQNDTFGHSALQGVMDVFGKKGFKNVIKLPYKRNDTTFDAQVSQLKKEMPDTIFFFGVVPAVRALINQAGAGFFEGKNLIGMSVYNELFEKFLANRGLHFVMVRVVPDLRNDDVEIVREYKKAVHEAHELVNASSLESFINAQLFFELIKHIDPPLTKDKIIKEIEGIKNYDFKGMKLNFDPNTRELFHTLWIDTGKGPWIKKEIPWSSEETKTIGETRAQKEVEAKKPAEKKENKGEKKKEVKPSQVEKQKQLETVPEKATPKKTEEPKTAQAEDKPEKMPLVLGSLYDLSKGIKQQGRALKEGLELRLNEEKKSGNNLISQIIIVDDEYTPRKTAQEVNNFLSNGIDIMLAPAGSPTLAAYLDKVKEGKVLVLFPITGAPIFRKKDLKYILHIRPSYKTEGKILTEYAIDQLKVGKGAMFYQDDAFGKGLLEGAEEVLKKHGITNWKAIPYMRNDLNFNKQVAEIKAYEPDAILLFCTTASATGLIRQIGIQDMSARYVLANSDFGEEKFLKFANEKGLKLIYLNVVPNPKKSDLPIVRQFRDAVARFGNTEINTFSLESYIAADFFVSILKKLSPPITKEKIIKAIENIKDVDYKGLHFNFNPENRTLSSTFWFSAGSPEWEKMEVKD